jgi:hypothetical protein
MASRLSYAMEVSNLYETEVHLDSESKQDREIATQQALKIILTRILAGENILKDNIVKTVLANSTYFISEFQYSLGESTSSSSRLMRVLFDEKLLIDTLRLSNTGLWNEIRPTTLVWLVVDEQNKQRFFEPDWMPEVDLALTKATKEKKLPVLYPIQDLNEKQNMSISDVLSAYSNHLLKVSTRYDVVSTLAGKMINKGTCWKAEWTHYFDGKITQWSSPCGLINNVASNGFQGVYDNLSGYYAVTPPSKNVDSVLLKVGNIKTNLDREKVTNYFESLPMVKTVTWISEELGYGVYRLFYQGKRSALNKNLAKDHLLNLEEHSKLNAKEVKYKLISG